MQAKPYVIRVNPYKIILFNGSGLKASKHIVSMSVLSISSRTRNKTFADQQYSVYVSHFEKYFPERSKLQSPRNREWLAAKRGLSEV